MKKCSAILLSLIMALSILPVTVFAMNISVSVGYDNTVLQFEVEPSDSIENLKAKIQAQTSIPPNKQQLFYNSGDLDEGKTISDHNITDGALL